MTQRDCRRDAKFKTFLSPQEVRPLEEGVRGQKTGPGIYKLISQLALCLKRLRNIPA